MTENPDKEENQLNIESEKLPSENIIPTQKENTISKLQSEEMEVQKHPHHVMHKKKWEEYILEFFMLFLAVFLGFVAENHREDEVERKRAKEYVMSMVQD